MAATRTIQLKTEIPGPRSRAIVERQNRVVASPLALTFPVVAESARGVTITDVDGNTFIDFAGGVGTLNVGHSHPDVVAAAQEQLERFAHTDYTVVPYEVYVTLAERLAQVTAEDVGRVVRTYLIPDRRTIVIAEPEAGGDDENDENDEDDA